MRPRKFRDSGLTDRSERPTTHALFAPTEERKAREERRLRLQARRRRS